jgi:hypothetical protein
MPDVMKRQRETRRKIIRPAMDEAFKGQATVHRRDFRFRQDRGAAEQERIRSQSPQSV